MKCSVKNKNSVLNLQIASSAELEKSLDSISAANNNKIHSVSLNLYGSKILVRHFELPKLSSKEIKNALKLEALENFSLLPEQIDISYQVLNSAKDKIRGVFIAVPKSTIDDYILRLTKIRLIPKRITASIFSRINYFLYENKIENNDFCIIDFYKDGIINLAVFGNKSDCELLREIHYENLNDAEREIMYSLKYVSGKGAHKEFYEIYALGDLSNKDSMISNLKEALNTAVKYCDINVGLNGSQSGQFFNIDLARNGILSFSMQKKVLYLMDFILAICLLFSALLFIKVINQHLLIKKLSSSFTISEYNQANVLQENLDLLNNAK